MRKADKSSAATAVGELPLVSLPWDSAVLGISVAKVYCPPLTTDRVGLLIHRLSTSRFDLLYLDCEVEENSDHSMKNEMILPPLPAQAKRGVKNVLIPVGVNIIFERTINTKPQSPTLSASMDIEVYKEPKPCTQIENLAVLSGKTSRFGKDPNIPKDKFHRLYKKWLSSSLEDNQHCKILFAQEGGQMVGFAIAKKQSNFGLVSLVAVHPKNQGQGVGRSLIAACEADFFGARLPVTRIVTQPDNLAACRLYGSCGYREQSRRKIYHLWNAKLLSGHTSSKKCPSNLS